LVNGSEAPLQVLRREPLIAEDLIEGAAEALDYFSEDELEAYAERERAKQEDQETEDQETET